VTILRYITAFNGARDSYQLPLALEEIGALEKHLSDFYLPKSVAAVCRQLNMRVSSRNARGLPFSSVKILPNISFLNIRRRLLGSNEEAFRQIDRELSIAAGRAAIEANAGLFLHSGYAKEAFSMSANNKRLLFVYHPLPALCENLLIEDAKLHTEFLGDVLINKDDPQNFTGIPREAEECLMADLIVCASNFTKLSIEEYGVDKGKIFVAPYGADVANDFDYRYTNIERNKNIGPTKKFRYLYVGQGSQRKGLHHLLKAWEDVAATDSELILVVNRVDPAIKYLLDQPNIRVVSNLTESQLRNIYLSSDAFVMPSLCEGFGLVYLEALSNGLHCIGTMNTGLPDLGLDQACVSYVAVGDIVGLAEKMIAVRDQIKCGKIKKHEILEAAKLLSWERHRSNIQNIVKQNL
jgi:glycosyltransferase involved in cell wall biosynthesis